jgi:hypothetical protein
LKKISHKISELNKIFKMNNNLITINNKILKSKFYLLNMLKNKKYFLK